MSLLSLTKETRISTGTNPFAPSHNGVPCLLVQSYQSNSLSLTTVSEVQGTISARAQVRCRRSNQAWRSDCDTRDRDHRYCELDIVVLMPTSQEVRLLSPNQIERSQD